MPRIQETETVELSQNQGHTDIHSDSWANLGYKMRLFKKMVKQ